MSKQCIECGCYCVHANGLCEKCYYHQYYLKNKEKKLMQSKEWRKNNQDKVRECVKKWKKNNPEKLRISTKKYHDKKRKRDGGLSMSENRKCTMFLGVHVAEQVLSKVFDDVERQPYNNPGYDFICNKGKKIDVKSACLQYHKYGNPLWVFYIGKNKIADYFLCLAFDNRKNLNPKHMWLVPSKIFNNNISVAIATSRINKWDKHSIPIDKVSKCCNVLKSTHS